MALDQRIGAGQIRLHVVAPGIFGDQFLENFHRGIEATEAKQVLRMPVADVEVVRFEVERHHGLRAGLAGATNRAGYSFRHAM